MPTILYFVSSACDGLDTIWLSLINQGAINIQTMPIKPKKLLVEINEEPNVGFLQKNKKIKKKLTTKLKWNLKLLKRS